MSSEKIHLALLTYLPLFGFAMYGILTGFGNDLFIKILISGWIVVVVYQTLLAAVYSAPAQPILSIAGLLMTPILLLVAAWFNTSDYSVIFIEMAAIDMMGVIVGLIYAFAHKAFKDGIKDAPVFPILFTIGIMATAGYFLGKLFYRFFEMQDFDWITISIVTLAVVRSIFFFGGRLSNLTSRMVLAKKEGNTAEAVKQDRDVSVSGILITLGVWFILVPLLIWIRSLIIPYQ
jgi:hypothetical protein